MNPSASPPRTRRMGYGTRNTGAAMSSPATASSRKSRTNCSWVPKCIPGGYAAPTLLRMSRPLVAHVVGARPNYMKVAPVYAELEGRGRVEQRLIHTGQHYDAMRKNVY